MRVGVSIPVEEGLPVEQLVGLAREAERCGYDAVVAGEVAGPDVFALLAAVASATQHVTIGTGVVPMSTRPVGLLAMGFQTPRLSRPRPCDRRRRRLQPDRDRTLARRRVRTAARLREGIPAGPPPGSRRREARPRGRVRALAGLPHDPTAGQEDPDRRGRHAAAHGRPVRRARGRSLSHLVPARGGLRTRRARPRGRAPGRARPRRAADRRPPSSATQARRSTRHASGCAAT